MDEQSQRPPRTGRSPCWTKANARDRSGSVTGLPHEVPPEPERTCDTAAALDTPDHSMLWAPRCPDGLMSSAAHEPARRPDDVSPRGAAGTGRLYAFAPSAHSPIRIADRRSTADPRPLPSPGAQPPAPNLHPSAAGDGTAAPRTTESGSQSGVLDRWNARTERTDLELVWAVGVLTATGTDPAGTLPGRDRPYTDAEARAVTILYHRHAGRMLAAARRYFRHDDAATAEAVHEAFALLPRRLQGYAERDALDGFLVRGAATSARNLLLARVRRKDAADASLDVPDEVDAADGGFSGGPATDADLLRLENRALVARALARLADRERFVLLAFYYEGLSHEAIGRELGTTAGASNRLANTAKQKMRRWLEQDDVRSAHDALA